MHDRLAAGSMAALLRALSAGTNVGVAFFDGSGTLVSAIGAAKRLFADDPSRLQHPSLATMLGSAPTDESDAIVFDGILTFGDGELEATSVHGIVARSGDAVAVIVEPDESLPLGVVETLAQMITDATEREHEYVRSRIVERRTHEILGRALEQAVDANNTDRLTGVASRDHLVGRLESDVEEAHQADTPLSAVLIDLDEFKVINDRHGHAMGDRVLQRVGAILAECCRSTDLAGRYGGEEFLLLLPGTKVEQARRVAERVRRVTALADISGLTGVTISAGVAELITGETGAELLARADAALYSAKAAGRDRVATADSLG